MGTVRALASFTAGDGPAVIAGGDFTKASSISTNGVAGWNGTTWSALAGGLSGTGSQTVYALLPFDDGSGSALFVGGYFETVGGLSALNIARLDCIPRNTAPEDIDGDGIVSGFDLALLLSAWGICASSCSADLDGNGVVNGFDLALLLAAWG